MRCIIVTGGRGFIGRHLVERLASEPSDPFWSRQFNVVLNIDNLSLATVTNASSFMSAKVAPFFADLKSPTFVQETLDTLMRLNMKVVRIFNLAAESHVDRSIIGPRSFVENNVMATQGALELWRHLPNKEECIFHQVSTDEVFGELTLNDAPFNESSPYDPRSPYSASKAAADHLVKAYGATYGMPWCITYCSNNYGPGQHPEKFIPTVIRAFHNSQPAPLYGTGVNVRDWIHVGDHANALFECYSGGLTGVWCISAHDEKTNLEVIKEIYKHFPEVKKPYVFVDDRPGHDYRYALDSNKFRKETGWVPQVSFENGIKNLVY